jgi:hypothetical protein
MKTIKTHPYSGKTYVENHDIKEIVKMAPHNQQLYWDIKEHPLCYSTYFIKNDGLPFMKAEQDKGDFVEPIIDLYEALLILKD